MFRFYSILVGMLFWVSCSEKTKEPNGKMSLVATTGMVRDAVQQIVGESYTVQGLMGAGVDPHLFKPSHGDVVHLYDADIIVYSGLHLEGKMIEIFHSLSKRKLVLSVGDDLPNTVLHKDENQVIDPHIWFDVSLWNLGVQSVARRLAAAFPKDSAFFRRNAEQYGKQLDSLHTWIKLTFNKLPKERRRLVTAHDAFGYFGAAYGLEVRALQGISTASEFGLRDVANLTTYLTKEKIPAIFVESSLPTRMLQAVVDGCRAKGHEVRIGGELFSDALGASGSPTGTYIGMVKHNVETIFQALK